MVDGFNGEQGARAGVILVSLEGEEVSYAIKFEFKATNTQAEYEAFIIGLKLAQALQAERVKVRTDSQLVVNHFYGSFQAKDKKIEEYFKYAKQIMVGFEAVEVKEVPRAENY